MYDLVYYFPLLWQEYSVTFSSYFNVLWKEPRLRITDSFFKELNYTADASMDTLIPVNLELVSTVCINVSSSGPAIHTW